jgi:hypothetical protein
VPGFIDETLHLGNLPLVLSLFYLFHSPSNVFFCFLADLTKAMGTPIPKEKSAPVDLDLAQVGLHAPSKAPLQVGAGPLEDAPWRWRFVSLSSCVFL